MPLCHKNIGAPFLFYNLLTAYYLPYLTLPFTSIVFKGFWAGPSMTFPS